MSTSQDRLRSVNDRIRVAAAERGIDPNRLRRNLAFHRLLARIDGSGLILKGGYCLEVRLPDAARATKDVDLVGRLALTEDSEDLKDILETMLSSTSLNDGFSFRVMRAQPMRAEIAGAPAWRIKLTAILEHTYFQTVVVDLVAQDAEVAGATERLVMPAPLPLEGVGEVTVEAVDVYQHAAEKFHAYSRIYAQGRPSSRVKDLVDLVLLSEAGLLGDLLRLKRRIYAVYMARDQADPPQGMPRPPGEWQIPYAAQAADLSLHAATSDTAYDLVARLYAAALNDGTIR
ncbi:hypothetical protein BH23ACT6_BH23ACT6_13050 [soil metagenome]